MMKGAAWVAVRHSLLPVGQIFDLGAIASMMGTADSEAAEREAKEAMRERVVNFIVMNVVVSRADSSWLTLS
jgi:hypothetical protein